MGLFDLFNKKETFIGVDIGGGAIKVVELEEEKGRAILKTYGVIEQNMDKGVLIDHPDVLRDLLKKVFEAARVRGKKVMTALPSPLVFTAIINLSNLTEADVKSPERLATAIQWEAKKIVPLPLEEMVLDWKLVKVDKKYEEKETGKNKETVAIKDKKVNVQVLLIGAAKTVVKKYMDVFKSLGYELQDLDIESAALARALLNDEKETVMLIDIGSTDTYISIVKNNISVFERTVNFGGNIITHKFKDFLAVDEVVADQFKVDLSFAKNEDRVYWVNILKDQLKMLVNEIKYSINLFEQDRIVGSNVDRIVLTGGVALMPEFSAYLSDQLDMNVIVGDPWTNVLYPDALQPLIDEIGTRFGIAIGLALYGIKSNLAKKKK